jgi:hypothetical protein
MRTEAVGAGHKPLGGKRRTQDVLQQRFPPLLVFGAGVGCGVGAEAGLAHRQRCGDDDAGATIEDQLALREIVIDVEDLGVYVDVNDAPTLEVAEDASPSDLQNIGNVGGRKSRKRSELEAAVGRGGVDAVPEHRMQMRIELRARRSSRDAVRRGSRPTALGNLGADIRWR